MLNNDFRELIKKYRRYESAKKNKNIIISIIALLTLGIIIWNFVDFKSKPNISKIETNDQTTRVIVEKSHKIQTPKKRKLTKEELKTEIKEELKKELNVKNEEKKINKFRLQVTTKKSSKQQLLEFHRKKNSYSSAIALASYFYSKREYEDAIKWAILASKKNKFKEKPWLIYAKSKNAIGEVDKAKKALNLYLKKNESKSARNLLDSL
jgi:hypothetical protein